jgi:hypothetical protein
VTDWPVGKQQPPAGDGTEVGEVLGAPRPWRDGSDPIHYPGTHPLGTEEEFERGLKTGPLVYANTCDVFNTLTYGAGVLSWLGLWPFFIDPGGPMQGFMPCEGIEAVVRSVFQGRLIRDTFRLHLVDISVGPVGEHTVYADVPQPTDPSYHPIDIPWAQLQIIEYDVPVNCYWYAARDIVYFHFTNEAFVRGAFVSCELDPGVRRILCYADTNPPIHVPNTGGDLGITITALSFLSPANP